MVRSADYDMPWWYHPYQAMSTGIIFFLFFYLDFWLLIIFILALIVIMDILGWT